MSCQRDEIFQCSSAEEISNDHSATCSQWSLKRYTDVENTKDRLKMSTDEVGFESNHDTDNRSSTASSLLIPTDSAASGWSKSGISSLPIQPALPESQSQNTNSSPTRPATAQDYLSPGCLEGCVLECKATEFANIAGRPTTADSVLVAIAMRGEMQLQQQQERQQRQQQPQQEQQKRIQGDEQSGQRVSPYRIFQMDMEQADGRMHAPTPHSRSPSPSPSRRHDPTIRSQRSVSPQPASSRQWSPTRRSPPVSRTTHESCLSPSISLRSDSTLSSDRSIPSSGYPLSLLPASMQTFPSSVLPPIQSLMPSVSQISHQSSTKSQPAKLLRSPLNESTSLPSPASPSSSSKSLKRIVDGRERLEKRYQDIMGIMVGLHDIMARKVSKQQILPATPEETESSAKLSTSNLRVRPLTSDSEDSTMSDMDRSEAQTPVRPKSLPVRRSTVKQEMVPRPGTAPTPCMHALTALSNITESVKTRLEETIYKRREQFHGRNFWSSQSWDNGMSRSARLWRLVMWLGWVMWMVMALRTGCVIQGFVSHWVPPAGIEEILCLLEIMGLLEVLWLLKKVSKSDSAILRPTEFVEASTMTEPNPTEIIYDDCCYT